jgi:hypothetical protein
MKNFIYWVIATVQPQQQGFGVVGKKTKLTAKAQSPQRASKEASWKSFASLRLAFASGHVVRFSKKGQTVTDQGES